MYNPDTIVLHADLKCQR